MAYVIAQPCIGVEDQSCVEVCPVDCIPGLTARTGYEGPEQFFIHPDECIDCGACVPACPVEAIFPKAEVPEEWHAFIYKNIAFFE